ncbi:hypothetical protein [Streptomyces sp. NPDC054874]
MTSDALPPMDADARFLLSLAMTTALAVIGLAGPLTALGVISPGIFSGLH